MFRHTYLDKGLWRAWLWNGQALEISWPRNKSHNWPGVALQVLVHSNDSDTGNRMLNVAFGPAQVFIPMGISNKSYVVGDEPSWGFSLSREFGLGIKWGKWRKTFDWLFRREIVSRTYEMTDGRWAETSGKWDWRDTANSEQHPYTYILRGGKRQVVTATLRRERSVRGRRYLHHMGWPKETTDSIDISFSDEVGERSGSWKGGCIGCGYTMLEGETPVMTLRRMEKERKF